MGNSTFRKFLKERGLRVTREREAICQEVLKSRGHFDPEELFIALRDKGLRVSRASIYRTIPLLVEAGILEEVETTTDKHSHYERTLGRTHHDHMLCMSCGRVIEFYSGEMERLQAELCRKRGFEEVTHLLEIRGYCGECSRKRSKAAAG